MSTLKMTDFATAKPAAVLAQSWWDIFPVAMGLSHLAFQIALRFGEGGLETFDLRFLSFDVRRFHFDPRLLTIEARLRRAKRGLKIA